MYCDANKIISYSAFPFLARLESEEISIASWIRDLDLLSLNVLVLCSSDRNKFDAVSLNFGRVKTGFGDGVSKSIDSYVTTISAAAKLGCADEVEGLAMSGILGFEIVDLGGAVTSELKRNVFIIMSEFDPIRKALF